MAFGSGTINSIGGAVNDLFQAEGHRFKARGHEFERQNYEIAGDLAGRNAEYSQWSADVKQQQLDRSMYQGLGRVQSDVAGSGLKMSGSALDLLHESAANGLLSKEVAGTQGQITVDSYREQERSYRNMASAAQVAIDAENNAATGSEIASGFHALSAITSFLPIPTPGA